MCSGQLVWSGPQVVHKGHLKGNQCGRNGGQLCLRRSPKTNLSLNLVQLCKASFSFRLVARISIHVSQTPPNTRGHHNNFVDPGTQFVFFIQLVLLHAEKKHTNSFQNQNLKWTAVKIKQITCGTSRTHKLFSGYNICIIMCGCGKTNMNANTSVVKYAKKKILSKTWPNAIHFLLFASDSFVASWGLRRGFVGLGFFVEFSRLAEATFSRIRFCWACLQFLLSPGHMILPSFPTTNCKRSGQTVDNVIEGQWGGLGLQVNVLLWSEAFRPKLCDQSWVCLRSKPQTFSIACQKRRAHWDSHSKPTQPAVAMSPKWPETEQRHSSEKHCLPYLRMQAWAGHSVKCWWWRQTAWCPWWQAWLWHRRTTLKQRFGKRWTRDHKLHLGKTLLFCDTCVVFVNTKCLV